MLIEKMNNQTLASFGRILSIGGSAKPDCDNQTCMYFKRNYELALNKYGIILMECKKRKRVLKTMERHNNFIHFFEVHQGDAFVINKGVWHWATYPLNQPYLDYLVIFRSRIEEEYIQDIKLNKEIKF